MAVIARGAVELPAARMRDRAVRLARCLLRLPRRRAHIAHDEQPRLIEPQRQLIAAHLHLDRIPHRRALHERYLCARREPHLEQMMAQRPRALHQRDHRSLPRLQFIECHQSPSSFPLLPPSVAAYEPSLLIPIIKHLYPACNPPQQRRKVPCCQDARPVI